MCLSLPYPLYSLLPAPPTPIINVHHNCLGSTVPFIATLAHDTHHCAMLIFEMLLCAISLFRVWKLKSIMLVWNYRVELWRPFVGHIKHTMVCFKRAFMATLIQGLQMDQSHCFSNVVVSCQIIECLLLRTCTDMLCSAARIPRQIDRTSGIVHVEFIVDFEHMFYILLRPSDFVPK